MVTALKIPPNSLTLNPHHLSVSERTPTKKPNFNLQLKNPILSQLEQCTSMHHLLQLHSQMIITGLIHNPFSLSRLITFCALSLNGDLNYALKVFNQIQNPNLFTWNVMIRAFSRSNHPHLSIQLYIQMLSSFSSSCSCPDAYTFPFVLKSCSHLSALSEGQQVHAHMVKFGLQSDSYVSNSLIHLYSVSGQFELARLVFDKMPEGERSEVSVAAMIAGLVSNDRSKEAIELFCLEDWRKLKFDQVTVASVLAACARVRDLELGKEIHCYIEENGVEMSLILSNSLMNMYAKCGELEIAKTLFGSMLDKDEISWNALIAGLVENGYLEEGLEMFSEMKLMNIRANEATFISLILACTQLDLGEMVHGYIKEMGYESQVSICNALIDMYSRIGYVEKARKIFENMPQKDIVTWNSMIAGYCRHGLMAIAQLLFNQMPKKDNFSWSTMILGYVRNDQPKEAIDIYKQLLAEGDTKPDTVTLISVLSACSRLGALEEGSLLHHYIKNSGIEIDTTLGTALIDMYSKCGCLDKAMRVFEDMKERDVITWTSIISGLALNGRGKEAIQIFEEMPGRPNSVTFLSVLSACAHSGLVKEGGRIYHSMVEDHKIEPEMSHLGCMVDLFGRAGHIDEAFEFVSSLGYEVDASVWGALLGACRIHGNVKLGEIVAKKMVELEPMHEGAHVLLSNIYAEAGQWIGKKEVREKMRDEKIEKEVGMSWIEVDGILHEFAAGDILLKCVDA